MSTRKFALGERVWHHDYQAFGIYRYDPAEPGTAWVRFDGDLDDTWVKAAGLVPAAEVIR